MVAEISGFCTGGPLDGDWVSVKSDPFLAVDKLAGQAWVYRRREGRGFTVDVSHDESLQYPQGPSTGERALDWDRLPLTVDATDVISLGTSHEAYAGDPVDDGWGKTEETA